MVNERTHIVSTEMEELYGLLDSHSKAITNIEKQTRTKFQSLETENQRIEYMLSIQYYGRLMEARLDHLIEGAKKLLDILRKLKEGKIHPEVLNTATLHQIVTDIRLTINDLDLPVPMEHIRTEEIVKISNIDAIHNHDRTYIVIHLPLMDRNVYNLYKTHPIWIPQNLIHKGMSAFIKNSHPYLAISTNEKQFLKMDHEDLSSCTRTHYSYICSVGKPLTDVNLSQDCEVRILLQPSTKKNSTIVT